MSHEQNCPICGDRMIYEHDVRAWLHVGRPLGLCPVTGGTTR